MVYLQYGQYIYLHTCINTYIRGVTPPTFDSCTKHLGIPVIIHDQISTQFTGHGYMDDLTTDCSFDLQATCVILVLGLFFHMLFIGVCTTRLWQTCRRLVQELNICTVVFRNENQQEGYCYLFPTAGTAPGHSMCSDAALHGLVKMASRPWAIPGLLLTHSCTPQLTSADEDRFGVRL